MGFYNGKFYFRNNILITLDQIEHGPSANHSEMPPIFFVVAKQLLQYKLEENSLIYWNATDFEFIQLGSGLGVHLKKERWHYLVTDKDHWLKLFIRKLTWPTVANILATLPPISPFLDYLSCPLVYVFISTFCFLLVNLAVFDVLGVHSSFVKKCRCRQ
jgi:hypothetical protein